MRRTTALIAAILAPAVSWAGALPAAAPTAAPTMDEIGLASLAAGLAASGVLLLRLRKHRRS